MTTKAERPLRFVWYGIVFAMLFWLLPIVSSAQYGLSQATQINLDTLPEVPEPNTETTVTLNAYTLNTNGSSFEWYVDGVEQPEARNRREVTVSVGNVGTETRVQAIIRPQVGAPISVSRILRPASVDIIIESDSYTPGFYKGRALPGYGSNIRAVALVDAGVTDQSSLTYKWTLDNRVLFGGGNVGQSVAEFTLPKFSQPMLNLEVFDGRGNLVVLDSVEIFPQTPEVLFYAYNPLRGTELLALQSGVVIEGAEQSVQAAPYYGNPELIASPSSITWTINGGEIRNPSINPLEITLQGQGGSGQSAVGFSMINRDAMLERAVGNFTVYFNSN